MKLRQLKKIIDSTLENQTEHYDPEVTIEIQGATVGGTPSVPVAHADAGFDWDAYQFIITATVPLANASKCKHLNVENGYCKRCKVIVDHWKLRHQITKLIAQRQLSPLGIDAAVNDIIKLLK